MSTQQKTEPAPRANAEPQPEPGLMAKRVILHELGVPEETLRTINSVADADLLIDYYQKKQAKPKGAEELKAQFINPAKKGAEDDDPFSASGVLPKPNPAKGLEKKDQLESALDPLHPANGLRRNADVSRLSMVFVDGRWRVF